MMRITFRRGYSKPSLRNTVFEPADHRISEAYVGEPRYCKKLFLISPSVRTGNDFKWHGCAMVASDGYPWSR